MTTQSPTYRLGYRSDIEGLRAIAILLVVAAHAKIALFSGGFIGVDVFFVLSGYLITGLLLQEIEQDGTLKFATFYARRLKRLLPGLLLMLAVSCLFGRLLVAPGEQIEQAKAAAASTLWVSNFFFAYEHLNYFSPGSETNLFLHTWSLGVEEQFYLLWPILLVQCFILSGTYLARAEQGAPPSAFGTFPRFAGEGKRISSESGILPPLAGEGGGSRKGAAGGVEYQDLRSTALALATVAWTASRKTTGLRFTRIVMWVVLLAGLGACAMWMRSDPALAFYMMPARAWQFALGALVFIYFGSPGASSRNAGDKMKLAVPNWLGWVGLAAILVAAIWLSPGVSFPLPWAIVPAFGTAAILAAGTGASQSGVGALLSMRPLQAIGRVSYSWYLWHWPVMLLGATLLDVRGVAPRIALVALSFVLATIAYRFVETPIRQSRGRLARPRVAIAAAVVLMILFNALALRWHNAARDRLNSPEQLPFQQVRVEAPIIYGMGCDDWYRSAEVKLCAFGPADAPHTAVAFGDSVALQWFPAYAKVFDKPGWRLLVATKSSCPMVDEPFFYARIGRDFSECAQWRNDALARIAALKPDIVILGSTYTSNFSKTQWIEGTARVLRPLAASSGHVYLIRSTPVLPFDAPSCLAPRSWLYTKLSAYSACVGPAANTHSDDVFQWLKVASSRYANTNTVDMTDAICPDGLCHAARDGYIVFRDSQHLSTQFAASLSGALATALQTAGGLASGASTDTLRAPVPQSTP